MASCIFNAQQRPVSRPSFLNHAADPWAGGRPQAAPEPYLDALGRPLGNTTMLDLPNIKDDYPAFPPPTAAASPPVPPPAAPPVPAVLVPPPKAADPALANSWGAAGDDEPWMGEARDTAVVLTAGGAGGAAPLGAPRSGDGAAGAQQEPAQVLTSARRAPLPAHERAPASARGGGAHLQSSERQGSVGSTSGWASSAGGGSAEGVVPSPRAAASTSQGMRPHQVAPTPPGGGGHLAASETAAQLPAPVPSAASRLSGTATEARGSSARGSRARPDSPEAPRSGSRRRNAEDGAAAGQGSRTTSSQAGASAAVTAESEELQAELEECLDTIRWCASSVTRESLQDMKSIQRPSPVVKEVLEAVAMLLGQPENKWDKLKRLFSTDAVLTKLQKFNFQQAVTKEQFRKLKEHLAHPDFDEELIKTVCVPVVPLAIWCRAIGVYLSKTKFRGGTEVRPVAAAGAASPSAPRQERASTTLNAGESNYIVFEPDIEQMDYEELRHVRDLAISRPGVGRITFQGETDCRGVDFERVVRLEIGEVLVYPEASSKPPVGMGLNKPATVTMYQCWPPNGSKLLQDAKSQERYKKKIKQMTEEKHAQFIDYDCSTGVWKFAVEHF